MSGGSAHMSYTVSTDTGTKWEWGYGGGSGDIHTEHIHINDRPFQWPEPDRAQSTFECLICGHEGPGQICELCRQAVLMFRQKVLEEMARDLAEMEEDI